MIPFSVADKYQTTWHHIAEKYVCMYVCIRVGHKAGPCTTTFNGLFPEKYNLDVNYIYLNNDIAILYVSHRDNRMRSDKHKLWIDGNLIGSHHVMSCYHIHCNKFHSYLWSLYRMILGSWRKVGLWHFTVSLWPLIFKSFEPVHVLLSKYIWTYTTRSNCPSILSNLLSILKPGGCVNVWGWYDT
jgi:hypothetical protein